MTGEYMFYACPGLLGLRGIAATGPALMAIVPVMVPPSVLAALADEKRNQS
ncbi:hypothetical protein [Allopontixanthobacter sp.]|uniref:hypothetical protein n=1 Tax=Allopontixanthobacter sp. TaxID=2906452 RepID=UPI002ABA692A|nr:hypothetical protein [Allopontixanthobacter sp.]MDZ4308399.1 hypothetical protein [Allopontixanthobacter sp.]